MLALRSLVCWCRAESEMDSLWQTLAHCTSPKFQAVHTQESLKVVQPTQPIQETQKQASSS